MIRFGDIIGNEALKTQIGIAMSAAQRNNRALPHVILTGMPGCGKTTTAQAIAELGGYGFVSLTPDMCKSPEDLAKVLNDLPGDGYNQKGEVTGRIRPSVLFIDEAHNLPLKAQELLGIAMENWRHSYTTGKGKLKKLITTWVPAFTVICATTEAGKLSKPFRDRFKIVCQFQTYNIDDSCKIVLLHARKRSTTLDEDAILEISKRSRGTPRLIVRYLEQCIDVKDALGLEEVSREVVLNAFSMLDIDDTGLTKNDRSLMKVLARAQGEPLGLENLAIVVGEPVKTVSDLIEPYLIINGYISRTGKGRIITDKGLEYLAARGEIDYAFSAMNQAPARAIE